MVETRPRHIYIDVLRFVASVMVIANHVLSHYINLFQTRGITWVIVLVLRFPTICAVPLFLMITGTLMLKPVEDYGKYLLRRLRRIYVPLLCWSLIYYLLVYVLINRQAFSAARFGLAFLSGDVCGQYWYLYALLPMYLLFPMIWGGWQHLSSKQQRLTIGILLLFGSLLPYVNLFWKGAGQESLYFFNFGPMGTYLAYALLGHYLHTHELSPRCARWLNALALLGLVALNVCTYFASGDRVDFRYANITNPAVVCCAVAVFANVKRFCVRKPLRRPSFWSRLGELSFTAYLTHMILLRAMQIFWSQAYVASVSTPWAAVIQLSEFLLCLAGSYAAAYAAHKLPGLRHVL